MKKLFLGTILSLGLLLASGSVNASGNIGLTLGANYLVSGVTVVNYGHTSNIASTDILPYSYNNALKKFTATFLASDGFSNIQGKNNWYYQEWNGSSYVDMTWNSSVNRWVGYTTDCTVAADWQHPERSADSVRKWVAPESGSVKVTAQVFKQPNGIGGDGVVVTVKKNVTVLWSTSIAYNDTVGKTMDLTMNVTAGDAVYFILNRNGEYTYDSTNWNPKITYQ